MAVIDEELSASLASHKRAVSTKLSYSTERALVPPTYRRYSLRELRDFLLDYDVYFDVIEEHATRR
jgi:hypothetical protein